MLPENVGADGGSRVDGKTKSVKEINLNTSSSCTCARDLRNFCSFSSGSNAEDVGYDISSTE